MMFKGTRRHGPGEFSRLVAEAGGRENAFTSTDFTVYHEQVHRDRLPLAMRLEADRMVNLVVRPEEFAQEIKVVMEERRLSYEDRPRSLLYENLLATAFAAHPYKWPTIGWMQDLQNMSWEDAQSWYRRWYAPGNATVIVVGDVEPQQVLALARRYYGVLPRRTIPGRKALAEPAQRGPKRVTLKAAAELPYVRLGYKVPALRDPANDWEPFAISLIAQALGGSDAARFNQILVRERGLATSAEADYELISRGPGMLFLDAAAAKGRSASELEGGIREIVARVAADGLSPEELERAKVQRLSQVVFRRDSFFAQALELGELESVGLSFRDADRIAERFKAITLEQVRAAAARYLVEDGLTVAVLDPQPLNPRAAGAAAPAAKH
jgi:zinc protease